MVIMLVTDNGFVKVILQREPSNQSLYMSWKFVRDLPKFVIFKQRKKMSWRSSLFVVVLLVISVTVSSHPHPSGECSPQRSPTRPPLQKPNFVVFFADDMGYGDLASYGHPTQERGPIDDVMVEGGIKFTQGYVPDTICSPSRAALLTGKFPSNPHPILSSHLSDLVSRNSK